MGSFDRTWMSSFDGACMHLGRSRSDDLEKFFQHLQAQGLTFKGLFLPTFTKFLGKHMCTSESNTWHVAFAHWGAFPDLRLPVWLQYLWRPVSHLAAAASYVLECSLLSAGFGSLGLISVSKQLSNYTGSKSKADAKAILFVVRAGESPTAWKVSTSDFESLNSLLLTL